MLLDHDFHPDEDTVRVFRTPGSGVLRLDDEVFISQTRCYGGILRHYAFSKHWFKINISLDEDGRPIAPGDGPQRFAFNCDIATPMERDGGNLFGVDLFIDVLLGPSAESVHVQDEDELREAVERGFVSKSEAIAAEGGLNELLRLVETKDLVPWLTEFHSFDPCDPPVAPAMERVAVPARMRAVSRSTW